MGEAQRLTRPCRVRRLFASEDENVLRHLSSDDENVLRRASDDDDLFCRVHFIGFHSSEGWVGKRLWKKKRDGLSGTG